MFRSLTTYTNRIHDDNRIRIQNINKCQNQSRLNVQIEQNILLPLRYPAILIFSRTPLARNAARCVLLGFNE